MGRAAPAYLAGWRGTFAAAGPMAREPTAPYSVATALRSHGRHNGENMRSPFDDVGSLPMMDGSDRVSPDRSDIAMNGNPSARHATSPKQKSRKAGAVVRSDCCSAKPKAKKSAVSSLVSMLCAVAILFGTPNLEGIAIPGQTTVAIDCKALAVEPTSNDDPSASAWSSSSALTEQLFKSMSTRESTKSASPEQPKSKRYWDIQMSGSADEIASVNERLVDSAVATISTMYYDTSGGFNFNNQEFYANWKKFRSALHRDSGGKEAKNADGFGLLAENGFATRDDAVKTLKSIVTSLNDPYSKYLTRDELRKELQGGSDGFLGLGALVDVSPPPSSSSLALISDDRKSVRQISSASTSSEYNRVASRPLQGGVSLDNSIFPTQQIAVPMSKSNGVTRNHGKADSKNGFLSVTQGANLPVVTAIIPDSPAERAGLVVGDRLAAVGEYQFTGKSRSQVEKDLRQKFHGESYFGRADMTVAKPVSSPLGLDGGSAGEQEKYVFGEDGWYRPRKNNAFGNMPNEQLLGYKMSHLASIPTTLTAKLDSSARQQGNPALFGGDAVVHWELLTPDDSIFQHLTPGDSKPVGYIRLTRFSKSATAGYINAVNSLEEAGATSYIIDLRNNYGGVIQEGMLVASTLLRDPYSVLCYTLNSRGGFKPQENMEYIVDKSYPGYLMSSESNTVSRDQVRREHPEYLEDGGWTSPTSYASLKELRMTRGIKPAHAYSSRNGEELQQPVAFSERKDVDIEKLAEAVTRNSQKKLVILINEGTASAAEVFASALHDNGRTVALVGTKTFGKGLIQHTFPMPDGGGLRLTVAEYLTPSLQHVTKVGGAKFDSGVKPDRYCESKQGIPQNIGADLCVGVALDVLQSEGG